MENTITKKAIDIILSSQTAILSSIDDGGYPRAVSMSNIKTEGIKTIWFATGTSSAKVQHYKKNNKASICYNENNNGITLTGNIEIVDDMNIKKALWVDWFIEHFPSGMTDPEYCILKFTTEHVILWIDNIFEKFSLDS